MGYDYYHYDEPNHQLIGEATGETFRLGDIVDVKLVEAAPLAGALRFEMLTEGRKHPKGKAPGHLTRKGRGKSSFGAKGRKKPGTTRPRSTKPRGKKGHKR